MKRITIEPVSRIEGHAKITIQLDDEGKVADTQFQVTQVRGFEKFHRRASVLRDAGNYLAHLRYLSHQPSAGGLEGLRSDHGRAYTAPRETAARVHSLWAVRAVACPQLLLSLRAGPVAGHGLPIRHP